MEHIDGAKAILSFYRTKQTPNHYGFHANISFTFQAVKNLYAHPTYLCFGSFCNFLVIFRYILIVFYR